MQKIEAVRAAIEQAVEVEGRGSVVHCYLGGVGADWDLEEAIKAILDSDQVDWVDSFTSHNLRVRLTEPGDHQRTYFFEIQSNEKD